MTLPNGVSANYNFDDAGRLAELKYTKGTTVLKDLLYGYDAKNRRTSYTGNTAPEPDDTAITATAVNNLNQYTNFNGQTLQHDLNGNLLKDAAVWDARDRLISLTSSGITSTFTYDALDRRTSITINGQTETYLYDGQDIISESGAVISVYTHGSGEDEPLIRKSSTQNEYYLADHLGSIIGLTDINGNLKTSYNYSAYGKKQSTGAASSSPFAFTGRGDDGNGYYYYRARYYNPDLKRFTAEDSAGFWGGDTNLYGYVGGGPTNRRDPSGRFAIADDIIEAIVFATIIYGTGQYLKPHEPSDQPSPQYFPSKSKSKSKAKKQAEEPEQQNASDMPVITQKGSKGWKDAVNNMRTPGKGKNCRVKNKEMAEELLKEARGELTEYPT
jgi:RHS repeat-associated protein